MTKYISPPKPGLISRIATRVRTAAAAHWGVFRYLLPVLALTGALLLQVLISLVVSKQSDFPYTILYLVAIFVAAWVGGFVPGAISCVLTMVALPALADPGFSLAKLDLRRLIVLIGVSLLISMLARNQRRAKEALRLANERLDERVRDKTADLARTVVALEAEIAQRENTEKTLNAQLERLNLLDQITRAVGERQDLRSVFQAVIRRLEDSLPIDLCCFCTYDDGANTLTVSGVGVGSEAVAMELALTENSDIPIDQNGLSRCVSGRLVYEEDVALVEFPFPRRLCRGGLRSLVAAPLLVESKVFGVLIAARKQPRAFTSGDCEFLRQVSEHVALAAHQAQTLAALQQAYEDLRQSQQAVLQQERLRALGQMASGIAHDINNAISPIALYTELLLEREPNLSPRTREYLETAQRAIGDVSHTVSRMREFYRQQETQLTLVPVDLNLLITQVIDHSRARWSDMPQQRGFVIDVKTDFAQDLPPVAGIESEIREALTNLVFNAVDAMPEGGSLTLRTRSRRDVSNNSTVEVDVVDTGSGMSEDTRRRCMEPFFTTKGERGTGLGLAMVYGVVQRHRAEIEIESAEGRGTTMRLKFAGIKSSGLSTLADRVSNAAPPRLKLLLVDDDPLLIKSLRETLEADGHTVMAAQGGQEGIDLFTQEADSAEPFAAVVTDLGMPYVDGRKVAQAIKAKSASTPVVLLTGWGQRLMAEGDLPPHVDRVLSKPPKLRDLRDAMESLVARREGITSSGMNAVGMKQHG